MQIQKLIPWVAIGAGLILFVVFAVIVPGLNNEQNEDRKNSDDVLKLDTTDLVLGNPKASRLIIEYGDYKCPTCARLHSNALAEINKDYVETEKAKIVFRALPVINPGTNENPDDSYFSAMGAHCANEQNLFEEYHNSVYNYMSDLYDNEGVDKESETVLTPKLLGNLFTKSGGNKNKLIKCIEDKKFQKLIDRDLKSSELDEVVGTPTIIINQKKIIGAQPISIYRTLLESK